MTGKNWRKNIIKGGAVCRILTLEQRYNMSGQTMLSPEDQLLEMSLCALAYGGYQALTVANMRHAGADEALLAPLRTREKLCKWALDETAERIRLAYELVTEQARVYLAGSEKSQDESIKQLERLLYRHIHLCLHPKNRIYVLAAANEAQLPQSLNDILPKALQVSFCDVLEEMILSVAQVKSKRKPRCWRLPSVPVFSFMPFSLS